MAANPPVILFCDDEAPLRKMYESCFSARGFSVRIADDGCAAVNAVRAGGISAAVLDLCMPNVDGQLAIEVIAELAPDLPLIVVSGHIPPEFEYRQMPGVKALLRKPASLDAIERALRKALA